MPSTHRISKITDKELVALFNKLEKAMGLGSGNFNFGNFSISFTEKDELKKLKKDGTAVANARFTSQNNRYTIDFHRGISKIIQNGTTVREPSAFYDELILNSSGNPSPTAEEFIKINDVLKSYEAKISPNMLIEEDGGAVAILQAKIGELSKLQTEMIKGLEASRKQLQSEYQSKNKELEKEYKNKKDTLDRKADVENQKLDTRDKQLDDRETTLDNRQHMHARRKLRESIGTDLKQRLSESVVSGNTAFMRWGVFGLSFLAFLFLGYHSVISVENLSANLNRFETTANTALMSEYKMMIWLYSIKSILSSVGTFFALFYSINWLRRNYEDDVRTERELEKYGYDINRASWAIETIMEMETVKGKLPPQTWIEAICKSLFENGSGNDNSDKSSPLEALLNSSAKVELGADGPKFEISGRGAKKLANKISEMDK